MTLRTRAFARIRQPAATARGSSDTCIARLASIAQPVGQVPQHTTSPALRAIGPFEAPIASAPSRQSSALRPTRPTGSGVTSSARSTASNSPSSSVAHGIPCCSRQA